MVPACPAQRTCRQILSSVGSPLRHRSGVQIDTGRRSSLLAPWLTLLWLGGGCAGDNAAGETETSSGAASVTMGPSGWESAAASTGSGAETATTGGSEGTDGTGPTSSTSEPSGSGTGEPLSCAGLPLCDGFEGAAAGGPPDPSIWSVVSPNCSGLGTLTIDDQVDYRGGRSLRVDGAGGYCDHIFIANEGAMAEIAGEGSPVYGRFYIRLGAALGTGHVTFLTLRDEADGGKDLRMGGQSEILMWNRESDDATLPALSPAGIALSVRPPVDAWSCVEFMVDGASGSLRTWVDGAEVPGLEVDGEPTMDVDHQWHQKEDWKPGLSDLKLGWESYAGQSMTLWFDEVALAGERIGCG